MDFHDPRDDRQAQSGAAETRMFPAPETVRQGEQSIRVDPGPTIGDPDLWSRSADDHHLAARGGYPDGILDQIAQRRGDGFDAAHDRRGAFVAIGERHPLLRGIDRTELDRFQRRVAKVDGSKRLRRGGRKGSPPTSRMS